MAARHRLQLDIMLVSEAWLPLGDLQAWTLTALPDAELEPRAVVLLLCDQSDHASRYLHVLQRLAMDGYAAFAFDPRGTPKLVATADWH